MESAYRFVVIVLAVIVGTGVSPASADPRARRPSGTNRNLRRLRRDRTRATATPAGNAAWHSSKGNAAKAKSAKSETLPNQGKDCRG